MNSAAAIIEAVNARESASRLRQAARESWSSWLQRMAQRPGRVTGAPVEAIVETLAAREPAAPPPRDVELNRWRAFATLWRQHWHPASADERRWRWTAGGVSFGWHVLVVILLLIVTALNYIPPQPADEEVVQVEYIGRGTPVEEGGGAPPAPARSDAEASPASSGGAPSAPAQPTPSPPADAAPATASTPPAPSTPAAAPVEAATPDAPPQTAPQPVVVTTPVSPEPPTFTLPPTSLPTPAVQPVRAAPTDVQLRPIREIAQAPRVDVPAPVVEVRRAPIAPAAVTVREVPVAPRAPAVAVQAPATVEVPRAAPTAAQVQPRDIPVRSAPSTSPGTAASTATSAAATASAATTTGASAPGTAASTGPRSSTTAGVGTGPRATPAPGSWATPRRGDDWGESTRDRPGNSLFDGDGRPRLAEGPGSAAAAHPPGMITQEIRDLDRAGTWLKRKPYPYEPTRWDRFWRPNDTLLEQWVRSGVKEVGIPIPGTKKKIKCVISILQLGGGCFDIFDPNMQDRPATARPPPDVPFKPGLQEGNGATWDKPATPPPPKLPGLFAPSKLGLPPGSAPAPSPAKDDPPPKLPGLFAPSKLGTPPSDGDGTKDGTGG